MVSAGRYHTDLFDSSEYINNFQNTRFNINGFQIKRTGTYKYTLLAENYEGNDSKTFEVTVLGKDSMLLNFIQCR